MSSSVNAHIDFKEGLHLAPWQQKDVRHWHGKVAKIHLYQHERTNPAVFQTERTEERAGCLGQSVYNAKNIPMLLNNMGLWMAIVRK